MSIIINFRKVVQCTGAYGIIGACCKVVVERQNKKAVLSQRKPRDATAILFGLKSKFKNSQASTARLQGSKHIDAKQNLMQNGYSRSFKVTCFGVSRKATRD